MNERLKELFPNPYTVDYQVPHDGQGFDLYDEKKMIEYGQRIIIECINICNQHPSRILSNNWSGENVASDIGHRLSKHFGVKESQGWVCPKCGVVRTKEACPNGHNAAVTGHCPMVGVAQ